MDVVEELGGNAMSASVLERPRTHAPKLGACPILETRRLVLRPHQMSDADDIARSLDDWQVTRMLSRVPAPYSRGDALDWLNMVRGNGDWHFAITEGDGVHIGCVSIELRLERWHLGYWLNRSHWGQGMMTEAVADVLGLFFSRMPDVELFSGAFADNAGSLRIQERMGFSVVGCSDLFSMARNAMAPHLETRLQIQDFRRP